VDKSQDTDSGKQGETGNVCNAAWPKKKETQKICCTNEAEIIKRKEKTIATAQRSDRQIAERLTRGRVMETKMTTAS